MALGQPLLRPDDQGHQTLPEDRGLDSALHGDQRRSRVRARVPWGVVHSERTCLTVRACGSGGQMTISTVLLDIEGTTTPIDFVYKTLFPYARARLKDFIARHRADEAVRAIVADLFDE